ncbi:hypothetical protein BGZ54_000620, partial [Gamsiella multidivaricata]
APWLASAGPRLWPRSSPSASSASAAPECSTPSTPSAAVARSTPRSDRTPTSPSIPASPSSASSPVRSITSWAPSGPSSSAAPPTSAQGAIMMAYPREKDKGKFIGYFWAIFNCGAVLGSVIAFAINFHVTEVKSLGDSTYIVFIVLMAIGTLIALSLVPPSAVTHSNGDRIQIQEFPTWTGEIVAVMKLFLDWRMIVLIPMFLSSNWFYSYQFSTVNGFYFSTRTQSLNNIFYWFSQIGGSWTFARVLDYQGVNRRTRALWGLAVVTVCFVCTWIGGVFFQRTYNIHDSMGNHDFKEGASYIGPLFLYMFYGLNDAAWQTYCYWLMGALSNDVAVLSRYAGFYKCIQSSGGAIAWRINAVKAPFMTELIICFALLAASIPGALFLSLRIKDHSDDVSGVDNVGHKHEIMEKADQKSEYPV